jgi:alpha-L-fucosidase
MDNKQWFKSAKFGMMIHWGLYSLIAGEWKGKRTPQLGEWAQFYFKIPKNEYQELASVFNPIYFDAESWVKLAVDAGMKYIVITSKHHDGFAMYHSKVDKYNIYDSTPFKRDVIKELAEACRKYGIKLGLYYSQDLDWHEPDGGGYLNPGKHYNTNSWDFPERGKKDYQKCFENKIKPQVKEILQNYGDLCLVWFDTPMTISKEQSTELFQLVKDLQPSCLVNTRIGNGLGDYRSMGDNQIPDEFMENELAETPATLNDTWGYKSFDNNWKPVEEVLRLKKHLNERGINYLLNVGPDYLGRIPAPSVDILHEAGKQR